MLKLYFFACSNIKITAGRIYITAFHTTIGSQNVDHTGELRENSETSLMLDQRKKYRFKMLRAYCIVVNLNQNQSIIRLIWSSYIVFVKNVS